MRTLKFVVDGQIIKPDPNCDFSDLVPGTEGYLQAEFSFSSEWSGYAKVAGFWSVLGEEYPPQILQAGKTCIIPSDILKKRIFKIQIIGKRGDLRLKTNKIEVKQTGGAR
jgi:hypothetical protein